jgi:predicted O-methyltransferase YrrM
MNPTAMRLLQAPFHVDFWRKYSIPDLLREVRVIACAGLENWQISRNAYYFAGYPEGAEYWCREIALLLHRLGKDSPRFVLEIGVGQGASMSAWARVCARNAHLIGVDDFGTTTRSSVGARHTAAEIRERILNSGAVGAHQKLTLISGNSHSSAVKQTVVDVLQGDKLDFLFIDADHSYEGVTKDFRDYSPLVRERGVIAFHDIVPDFKTRCGIDTKAWAGDVYRFWAELCQQYEGISIIDRDKQDACGIGLIRYSSGLQVACSTVEER